MPDRQPSPPPDIAIDIAVEADGWPAEEALQRLAKEAVVAAAAATGAGSGQTLGILFTDDENIRTLNARFRGKDKPTNVLSFPAPPGMAPPSTPPHMGDIALARETIVREANAEGKAFDHHLTHLVIHGFLHLAGYDHETGQEAEEMESLERRILKGLAIGDPYA
ncbi:rRNA maturation RNase YbeY [Chelativorans salis]|uniref:Endoribonuclease YbeY n=1 Tax=Chelativorans salis TaxID=2978478 RepID=A0ABT2LLS7_9HYPH|nr:rRNA maturation RNase YbeY [Chelativorans sp. EGI FJ00035]MCT7374328.1 rRNA maturation RNase YbeY [Chelativorans sp. EGI FJ00035]